MTAAEGTTWQIVLPVPTGNEDAYETALGPLGIATELRRNRDGAPWVLSVLCPAPPEPAAVDAALALLAIALNGTAPPFEIREVPPRDWVAATYRAFPPLRAGRFFVHGAHYSDPPPLATIALQIDAATAFGLGEHATTRGCLLALDRLAKIRRFKRILDVGTGTGILAMAAVSLWPGQALATDIDPEAVRVARQNVAINGLTRCVRTRVAAGYADPAVRRARPFDLIIANILARPLCTMAGDLAAHLAPGGLAVLSGFIDSDEALLMATHRRVGLRVVARIAVAEWRTLVVQKGARR